MEKQLIDLLKKYNFNMNEILDLTNKDPVLEYTSYDDAKNNLMLIVSFGYPEDDLGFLISMNTQILSRNFNDLEKDLKELALKNNDIEEILKNNPFLI